MFTPKEAAMRHSLKLLTFLLAIAAGGAPCLAQTARIAVGAASVSHLPGWMAVEGGYFARQELHPELIFIRGGPQTVAALLGGDVALAQVYSQPLLSAKLGGADTVIIAGLINQPLFSLMAIPAIEKPQDLRGKKVGITTFGSATDLALRLALKHWGLKAESDVSILQIRGVPEILSALQTGAIQAGIVSPPTNMMAIKAGFREIAYLPKLGISFQHTTLATTRSYLARNRETTMKILRAYTAGIRRIKSDKAFAIKVLSKHFRTNDQEVLEYTYNSAASLFRETPYPTLEGIQSTLDFLGEKDPKARQAKPQEFVDTSLLDEIGKRDNKL
jgi:ABC-type nitrate/sulfonate/bicarbonate transport system substrate-binding protein